MRLPVLLLALLVPALVVAAPRTKKKKKKKATPAAETEAAPEPAPAPDPAPAAAPATPEPAKPAPPPPMAAPAAPGGGAGAGAGSGASTGGGAGEPKEDAKPANEPDVDSLRQEYLSLRDELFKSRARASTVASQLYSTRIQIKLTYTTGRDYNPGKAIIRLDGANVYEDATGAIAGDDGIRFDGYVAPGRHLITFRVEATGKDDDSFTSVTETQIVAKAVSGKDLVVAARAHDTGDIAYEWKRKERGSYGLGIDVSVKTNARAADDPKGAGGNGAKK
jgi:hypothetical protein